MSLEPGARFGRLTFVAEADERRRGYKVGRFLCECGQETEAPLYRVKSGRTKSCGCTKCVQTKHGMRRSPEYRAWIAAKVRCGNPRDRGYPNYGGRGITFCDEWLHDFPGFFAHAGPRLKGTTLDRIDNDRGYEPGNVRWATPKEQAANRRKAK